MNSNLENYCVYEKLLFGVSPNTDIVPQELQQLIDDDKLESNIAKDCLVVGPMAAPDVASVQENELIIQSGKKFLPAISSDIYPVRIALLDTLPSANDATQNLSTHSPHGATIAAIIHKLTCEDKNERCYASLSSQLAMPYISVEHEGEFHVYQDVYNGGYFGSISDLAQAIRNEIISWQEQSSRSRLILNLSLGWDPESWGGINNQPKDYKADVASVYDAIEDAVCRGALVIAAAGNQGNDSTHDQQPLLPARWEEIAAPSDKRCIELTGEYPSDKHRAENNGSLVYSVSGIDSLGQPLKNTRPLAKSRLATFADHVTVNSAITDKEESMTGSSIATAILSSSAALVWANRPDFSAAKVMDIIYQSADKLEYTADFYNVAVTDKQARRVSMCNALKEACSGGYCNMPAACEWPRTHANYSATSLFTDPINKHFMLSDIPSCTINGRSCKISQVKSGVISPWILPQPDPIPCPNCLYIKSQAELVFETSPTYSGTITQAELVVDNTVYTLPNFNLGDRLKIENFNLDPATHHAYISVLIDGEFRTTIPLLISQ
ncbi:S8/S53 family peptidase [Aliikangiella marina]|uniref:S8/S53 family peptidase n=1 Tax=Aliikangiella marina TaxID=1712262 RepID=UPI00163D9A67|nr:S8/S53 family peptidase [Aliikangiella marina]